MTNLLSYATAFHAKWGQREDPLPQCDHLSQEASLVVRSMDGYVTSTYRCLDCGKSIVRTYRSPAFSEISAID